MTTINNSIIIAFEPHGFMEQYESEFIKTLDIAISDDAEKTFLENCKSETLAVVAYAIAGLKIIASDNYNEQLNNLREKDGESFISAGGCLMEPVNTRGIAAYIERTSFEQFNQKLAS